ncbi:MULTISPECIES: hypothetical protein [unclassified Streptomyces]|uniref:hypothetical protein n=1 Tax=unclassified Streptomyces TaxID=2593676 RepID=UPI0019648250
MRHDRADVGTALNVAMTGAIREHLATRPEKVDARGHLTAGREATVRTVATLIQVVTPTAPVPPPPATP